MYFVLMELIDYWQKKEEEGDGDGEEWVDC